MERGGFRRGNIMEDASKCGENKPGGKPHAFFIIEFDYIWSLHKMSNSLNKIMTM